MNKYTKVMLGTIAFLASTMSNATIVNSTTGNMLWYQGGTNSEGQSHLAQGFTVNSSQVFTRTLTGLDTTVSGNATFTVTAMGELDNTPEHIDLLNIDGFNLGRIFNNISADDLFNNSAWGDNGRNTSVFGGSIYQTPFTLVATISESILQSLIGSDGELDINFSFAPDSNNYYNNTSFINFSLSYDSTSVPEPSAIALMGLGLLGFVATRRRIKK